MTPRLTLSQIIALVVIVLVLGLAGWAGWQGWRARHWKDAAQHNAQAAATAQANATSANAGAANATQTRAAVDATASAARDVASPSATRIRDHADDPSTSPPATGAGAGTVPADVVRELREGERRARAAADRLQRARGR